MFGKNADPQNLLQINLAADLFEKNFKNSWNNYNLEHCSTLTFCAGNKGMHDTRYYWQNVMKFLVIKLSQINRY